MIGGSSACWRKRATGYARAVTCYGWIIVGVGVVVTCVGFGAMLLLGVFLQPLSEAMGWFRTAISTAALVIIGSGGIGLGVVAIASTFRPPRALPVGLPTPSVAH